LGPLVLLRGDQPTHYLNVALPMFVLVAASGVVQLIEAAATALHRYLPALQERLRPAVRFAGFLLVPPLVCLSVVYYRGAWAALQEPQARDAIAQGELDALGLQGRKLACRNMSWFVDRPVEAVMLPYASVAELETYAHKQHLDGILLWTAEKRRFFLA